MPIPIDPRDLASLQKGRELARGPGSRAKNQAAKASEKDTLDQIRTIRECTESNWKATKTWRAEAEESYKFVEGDQWDEKDRAYVEGQRRPAMTFNECLPQVRLLSGLERQNREELRVFPRDGSAGRDAEIMTGLVKYVLDENLSPWQLTRKSNDVYICGRGWVKTDISHDENINGDVLMRRRNPFQIFWDVMSDEWDGSDLRWVQDSPWMTEDEARELWPEFEDVIKVGNWLSGETPYLASGMQTGDRHETETLFLDKETKRVRALEHWYKKRELVTIAVNTSTGDVKNADEDKFKEEFESLDEVQRAKFHFVRRKMTTIRCATVMHWLLLQDKPSPFTHNMLPLIPYFGIQFMNDPFGIVRPIKDPQRLKNKAISQVLNHLNRSSNSGWLNKSSGGANKEQLEQFGSVAGVVINYEEEKPDRIEPVRLDAGHYTLSIEGDKMIDKISLLNAELQGQKGQAISGVAMAQRKQSGLTGNEDFFDNALLGDKILGYQLIGNIQQTYTGERIKRILASQFVRNPEAPLSRVYSELKDKQEDLLKYIDRCLKAEYDYVVDRSPQSITIRQENFKILMEAAKAFNVNGREIVPVDVIVDSSDLPENAKSRIKENFKMVMQREQMAAQGGMPGMGGDPSALPGGMQ